MENFTNQPSKLQEIEARLSNLQKMKNPRLKVLEMATIRNDLQDLFHQGIITSEDAIKYLEKM